MKRGIMYFLSFVFLGLLTVNMTSFYTKADEAVLPPFDRLAERAEMLALAEHYPDQTLRVTAQHGMSRQKKAFVDFFTSKIWPRLFALKKYENLYETYMVMLDRALYNDETEKKAWEGQMTDNKNNLDATLADPAWIDTVRQWARLAEGLSGELADYARDLKDQMELESYPPEALEDLQRVNQIIDVDIRTLRNTSTLVPGLAANEKAANDIVKAYFAGQVSFSQATEKLEALVPTSRTAIAQEVVLKGRALLHEVAVLHTRIAHKKGFKNWAELILARQAQGYSKEYQTVDQKVKFLKRLLELTRIPYETFIKKRLAESSAEGGGTTLETLKPSQLALLQLETDTLIRQFFPRERYESVWRQTMLESGDTPVFLDVVNIDGFPRANKQTHAYMANLQSHKPLMVTINGRSLSIEVPSGNTAGWSSARIFLVQNYRDDGPGNLETMFHEGGHSRDYSRRRNPFPTLESVESSTAYAETHSMTQERFLQDLEFLLANGRTREGVRLSRELAEKYIRNSKINALLEFRNMVAMSLYDIELWNHEYTEGGEDFSTRAAGLFSRLKHEAILAHYGVVQGVDTRFGGFVTDHFIGGLVRYIGYVFAEVGAHMTAEHLLDVFQVETGRRTLHKQPTLIPRLTQAYYENDYSRPYPEPVEAFTGKPFSAEAMANELIRLVEAYQSQPSSVSCNRALGDDGHIGHPDDVWRIRNEAARAAKDSK